MKKNVLLLFITIMTVFPLKLSISYADSGCEQLEAEHQKELEAQLDEYLKLVEAVTEESELQKKANKDCLGAIYKYDPFSGLENLYDFIIPSVDEVIADACEAITDELNRRIHELIRLSRIEEAKGQIFNVKDVIQDILNGSSQDIFNYLPPLPNSPNLPKLNIPNIPRI